MEFEKEAESKLRELLERTSFIAIKPSQAAQHFGLLGPKQPDFVLPVEIAGQEWQLICEFKAQAQPRQVRTTALELKDYLSVLKDAFTYPVILAPYISPQSAEVCKQTGVGYADFAGNCLIAFSNVYIEQSGVANPNVEKRELRSVFSPKSARIIKALLADPSRLWRVAELAQATGTSLGQVSNVRNSLVNKEWATIGTDGLRLTKPAEVLNAWRTAYKQKSIRKRYYSLLHGENLEGLIKTALLDAGQGAHALLASFSAARWLSPYARYSSQIFYADETGEHLLKERLQLQPVSKGENVVIEIPNDDAIFAERIEAAPGIWTTGLIQTYLDLAASGERGAEAAEHLRQTRIEPLWKGML